jgi:hypothetical protein
MALQSSLPSSSNCAGTVPAGAMAMSLIPKTATYPGCFGIACPHHLDCERYRGLEIVPSDHNTMATCHDGLTFVEFSPPPQVLQLIEAAAQAGHA